MPKLLLFAPCEKVIVDGPSNQVTLISIMQHVRYRAMANIQMPQNAVMPMQWNVLAVWQREEQDRDDTTFNQRLLLSAPNSQVLFDRQSSWRFETRIARTITRALGFPISNAGLLNLSLSYKRPESEWIDVGSFPIEVISEPISRSTI